MIEFKNIYKAYKEKSVLVNISLKVDTGDFLVLIGSSGCGKTTLLKMINKLNSIDKGDILIDNKSIKDIDDVDLRRKIGYVVQDGGLFPHLTIAENIAIILKTSKIPEEEINLKVDELLNMVNLNPEDYRDLYPIQLSGGQRQRVGVARAFSMNPEIILMDEPFSALDPVTRLELQNEICDLQKRYKKTVIFVTHDMDEGIKLASKICVIQNGHIVQCDTPENILKRPVNLYVKEFVGKNKLWSNPEFIKAEDIMKTKPFKISKDRTVIQAIQIMRHNGIDSVLVINERRLEGIVYFEDLIQFKDYSIPLQSFITTEYTSVYNDTSLQEILKTIDYNISGIIPVIKHDNEVIGYLTKSSLLATLSKQYKEDIS